MQKIDAKKRGVNFIIVLSLMFSPKQTECKGAVVEGVGMI
jgi:hypothetical protein